MDEESGNRGLWIVLIVALLAALAFLVLWYLRGGEVDRLNNDLRAAQAQAASTSQRLERDLRTAQSDADTASRRVVELENQVRDVQRRASEDTQQVERRLRSELDASAARISDLAAQLERERADVASRSSEELETLRGQSDEARQQLQAATNEAAALRAQLEEAKRDQVDLVAARELADERLSSLDSEVKDARARLEQSEQALREARQSAEDHPEVARLTGDLGDLQQRYEELENRLNASPDAADEEGGEAEGSPADGQLEDARRSIADLESRLAEARQQLLEQAAAAPVPAVDQLAGLEKRAADAEAARVAAVQELESVKQSVAQLQGTVGDLRASNNDIGRELETAHQDLAKAEAEAKRLREEYDALKREHAELADAEQTLQLHLEEVTRGGAEEGLEAVASVAAAPNGEPSVVINPGRSVGRIIDRMADGRTYIIDKGRRQGIRPGMRFDVHRPHDSINRFTGIIQVTQPMEDISVAMVVPSGDAAICPVTGRAYLEPGAKYSPYAMSAEGRPVPLISPASVGLDKESPAPGDLVDNPFYDPGRKLRFMICADVAGDRAAIRAIEALGCSIVADVPVTELDYLLVQENGAFAADVGGPRRVTPDHVAKYISVPVN